MLSGVITSSHNALAARFDIPLTEKANVITTKDNQPLEATYMPDSKNVIEDFKSETGLEKTNQNENRDEDNPTNLTLEPLTTAETVPENEPLPNNQAGNYQGSPKNGTGNGVGNQYRFQGANGKKGNSHMISE